MRILFVAKRSPQQRDLVHRPYGRFHFLPVELGALGHEVHVALVSHSGTDPVHLRRDGVEWSSRDLRRLGFAATLRDLHATAAAHRPDWIIGCSDTWPGVLAGWIARKAGARLAIDAYDDYEAYMPWNWPLHVAWRRAVDAADLVTAAGPQLAARLQSFRTRGRPAEILPMAADPAFVPLDRDACRAALELPRSEPLVGYSGSWGRKRGTKVLLESLARVAARRPGVRLVVSGRPPGAVRDAPGVIATGYLEDRQLPLLLNALDVACVITADTAFGRYSYPAKLCEAMACGVPVVATATAPVRWMLEGHEEALADVGDARSIAERILLALDAGRMSHRPPLRWEQVAGRLDSMLRMA